ncbi:hypothetical protein MMC07_009287 [Pseudocyphellaria aurata]|nr:hypothetical protein [Pseudocyphellaria aurata]
MSTLRAYVGSRDIALKPPGIADQPWSQAAPSDDRVQAKMYELGFSNIQDQFSTIGETQIESQSKRQTLGNQHRNALTRTKPHRNISVTSSTNRWPGYKSTPDSPTANGQISFERSLQNSTNHHDLFDTDTENLESTVTLSDLSDVKAFQAWPLPGNAATTGLNQSYESGYFLEERLPSVAERQSENQLETPEKSDLTKHEKNYISEEGMNELNYEHATHQDGQIGDGRSSQGPAKELNRVESIPRLSKEPTETQAVDAGSFMAPPTTYKKLVVRDSGERSSDSGGRFSNVPCPDPDHTTSPRRFITGTSYSPEHDQSRSADIRPSSSAGTPTSLEPGMPTETQISNSVRQDHHHKILAIGDRQFLMRHQRELLGMTARIFTTSEPPEFTTAKGYKFSNNPTRASLEISHDADDAAIESYRRNRGIDLDYNPSQLREMTYEGLRQESFDRIEPAQGEADQGLSEKLQNVYDLKGSIEAHSKRRTFFSDLTIDQYEECGDLMVEKFSNMVARFKSARQQKRKLARAFEGEIALREERMRAKNRFVDQDLGRLRKAGEDVVRGKGV